MTFAVIDFETTGFIPERGDRVVEVGVVLTDRHGNTQDEWATLINPRRDIGATTSMGSPGPIYWTPPSSVTSLTT